DIARLIRLANFREIIDRQQLRFGPEQSAQTLLKRGLFGRERAVASERRQLPDGALVLQKSESDLGKSQRRQRQVMLDVGALGFLAPKKFSSRRQVVKQLTHFDVRARRVAGGFDLENFSAVDDDLRAFRLVAVAFACRKRESADAGDTRQRFAP